MNRVLVCRRREK